MESSPTPAPPPSLPFLDELKLYRTPEPVALPPPPPPVAEVSPSSEPSLLLDWMYPIGVVFLLFCAIVFLWRFFSTENRQAKWKQWSDKAMTWLYVSDKGEVRTKARRREEDH